MQTGHVDIEEFPCGRKGGYTNVLKIGLKCPENVLKST
jgi:hypothetical protein